MTFLRSAWHGLIRLLTYRTVTLLTLLFMAVVIATLWNMSWLSNDLVQTQALQNAVLSAKAMREARTVYSSEAVARVPDDDVQITHDYLSQEGAIPLPATFLLELSRRLREDNPEMSIRVYSDYPFPWHQKDGGPQDEFEEKALQELRQNPAQPYISVEDFQGRQSLRYAEADIMMPSCVTCHNTYPGSPKTDWVVGDVRGILEITQPLDAFQARIRQGLKGTFLMLGGLSVIGISGLTAAIRGLQQRSQELAIARDQLEAVIDAVPGPISWIGSNGVYLGVNRKLADDWQISQEAFIGKEVGFLRGSDQLSIFLQQFLVSSDTSASQVIDVSINGEERAYLFAAQKYQNGEAIVSVGIDVTERKRAEKALRIAEENYRSIYENALEGIFQSNLEGRFISVNPAMARLYGYSSPDDMVNSITSIAEQIYVESECRDTFTHLLVNRGEVKGFEYRSYRKDGSIMWVEENTRAVRDDKGKLLYFEGIVQDISDRKLREADLKRQLQELQIEIDEKKKAQDVAKITESSYFQDLQNEIARINLDEFWD
ncbi:MAG: PAS domain S-box protein [Thainema sp.]